MSQEVISFRDKQKRTQLEKLLSDRSVFLKVLMGSAGLIAPTDLSEDGFLVLQISHHFRTPLTIGDNYFEQELLFGSRYERCVIPFSSIILASNESGEYIDWSAEHADAQSTGSTEEKSLEDENKSGPPVLEEVLKSTGSAKEEDKQAKKVPHKASLTRVK